MPWRLDISLHTVTGGRRKKAQRGKSSSDTHALGQCNGLCTLISAELLPRRCEAMVRHAFPCSACLQSKKASSIAVHGGSFLRTRLGFLVLDRRPFSMDVRPRFGHKPLGCPEAHCRAANGDASNIVCVWRNFREEALTLSCSR